MVRVVQLLCPERHCLLASAYEDDRSTFEEACNALKELTGPKGPFKSRCELCGSEVLHFEETKTPFKTLAEAGPTLMEGMMSQMSARAMLEKLGMTYDQRRKN